MNELAAIYALSTHDERMALIIAVVASIAMWMVAVLALFGFLSKGFTAITERRAQRRAQDVTP